MSHIEGQWHVLTEDTLEGVKQAPIYVETFRFSTPHQLVESEKFNIQYSDPSMISSVADKLRWYRYKNSLLQRDVADKLGIDRSTYMRYEEQEHDYYPIEHIEKLATLYGIPITDLLDEYNLFLYHDQGKQIRAIRQSLGMTQSEYAKALDVPLGSLKNWERNRVRIIKSTWQKHFIQ